MAKRIKTAVSLPETTFNKAESLRRKNGISRSALYAAALQEYFKAMEVREIEGRYSAGYAAVPEDVAEAGAMTKIIGEVLPKEDW